MEHKLDARSHVRALGAAAREASRALARAERALKDLSLIHI